MTYKVTVGHIIPFLQSNWSFPKDMQVLEIGCGEAGVLKAFTELGYQSTGIELEESRLEFAREFMKEELAAGKVQFLNKDIYDVVPDTDLGTKFDLIILKDVIEHIPDQARFMPQLHRFLKPGGKVFFAFPPWQMPFGGHQQLCRNKWLSKLPYYHLLPSFLYQSILTWFKEPVADLMEIRDTRISIEKFEKIVRKTQYNIVANTHYLINPIYEYKFNVKPRIQFSFIKAIPWLRNYFTTCVYYLITPTIHS